MNQLLPVLSLLAVVVLSVLYHLAQARTLAAHRLEVKDLLTAAAIERAELLLRVQHPEILLPPRYPSPDPAPADEPDEVDLVGTVTLIDPEAEALNDG